MSPVIVGVASRTLPCGTLVLVNYKGHRLTVPVIDRGPYGNGATWDLTWGAASALTITETVRIKTKIVGQAPTVRCWVCPPKRSRRAEAAGQRRHRRLSLTLMAQLAVGGSVWAIERPVARAE